MEKNFKDLEYYKFCGDSCLDYMIKMFGVEEVKSFCKLNAFKYRWRAGKKTTNSRLDINKAIEYEKYYASLCNDSIANPS